jgi:hypothetical protein
MTRYVLGSDDAEIARLDHQAAAIAGATAAILPAAGIGPGMRVLDLGTGLGHIDYDIGCSRAEPEVPLVTRALSWIEAAFRAANANPRIGPRLLPILRDAGFADRP